MLGREDDSENLKNLSIIEKMVMDACDACITLNSSKRDGQFLNLWFF